MPSLPRGHLLIYLPPSPMFRNSLGTRGFFIESDLKTSLGSGPVRQGRHVIPLLRRRSDDLHLLPVIGELSAAVQTCDVRARELRRRTATGSGPNRDRKSIMRMSATKEIVEQLGDHASSQPAL